MTDKLTELYNACHPLVPASPAQYVDCSRVRGDHALTTEFQSQLDRAQAPHYLRFLFSGHIGCGKSSELRHLAETLENPAPARPHKRHLAILLDASEYLDDYDVTPTDILLAIVAEVAATLREKGIGDLKDNYFVKRFNEVKEFFLTEVEIREGELALGGAKAKIQRLQKDPEARKKVRGKLQPQMTALLSEINTVFAEARLLMKEWKPPEGQDAFSDMVLILDNLEKIKRIAGHEEGAASQKELFIERAPQLTSLDVHVIYTVPLRFVRSDGPQLLAAYGTAPFVLPMIKVIHRDGTYPYADGVACLREVLQKRAGDAPIDSLFDADALDWLFRYSAGHVRDLMGFVQQAISYTGEPPVTLDAAKRALRRTVSLFSASIPDSHWPKLARLECSPERCIPSDDRDCQVMLEQVTILEYIDGEDAGSTVTDETFFDPVPWYAVNPIVRELREFKAAIANLDRDRPKASAP